MFDEIFAFCEKDVMNALDTDDKNVRDARMVPVKDAILENFTEKYPELPGMMEELIYKIQKKIVRRWLLADDRAVTLDVVLLQVVQQTSSVTNHLLQTAAAVEVLLVSLEVLGQVSDAVGQDSNLYFGRTCVALVSSILLDDVEFYFFLHGFFTFQKIFIYVSLSNRWVKKLLNSLVSENRAHAYDSIIPHFFGFVNTFFKTFLLYLYIFIIYFRSRTPARRKNHYFDEKKTKKSG